MSEQTRKPGVLLRYAESTNYLMAILLQKLDEDEQSETWKVLVYRKHANIAWHNVRVLSISRLESRSFWKSVERKP